MEGAASESTANDEEISAAEWAEEQRRREAEGPLPVAELPPLERRVRAAAAAEWGVGEECEVFYRTLEPGNGGYFPTASPTDGLRSPRLARTDCWVPATIARKYHGWDDEAVAVRHNWPHWRDCRGGVLDMGDDANAVQRFPPARVRRRAPVPPVPSLSLLLVRWGGAEDPEACDGAEAGAWGASASTVSATYAAKLLDSIYDALGPTYETSTAFVGSGADLDAFCERRCVERLAGRHVGAFYFLWPTQFDDGTAGRPGMVPADALLGCMQRLEAAGVPTRFPHASHAYRALLSKEWTTALSGCGAMATPPTTRCDLGAVERDAVGTANRAIASLGAIGALRSGADVPGRDRPEERGVAKLGFSWEAIDVRAWNGAAELADALLDLARQPGCRAPFVFVQERVDAVGEIRCYCVEGAVQKMLYTRFEDPCDDGDDAGRFTTFTELDRDAAIREWFRGDEALCGDAEAKARALAGRWLLWLRALTCEVAPFLRVDVFVSVRNGSAVVSTGELTELGASFLGWKEGPALVFGALLRSCFRDRPCFEADCPCRPANAGPAAEPRAKKKKPKKKRKMDVDAAPAAGADTPPPAPP